MTTTYAAIAYKYADPTEGARLVFNESDLCAIRREDPSLLICIGDKVESGSGEDHDTGRVERIDTESTAFIAWDSGVKTAADIARLRVMTAASAYTDPVVVERMPAVCPYRARDCA